MNNGFGALKDTRHSIVIFSPDGVKFMVMTTGTPNSQGHEGFTHGVHLFVYNVHLQNSFVL